MLRLPPSPFVNPSQWTQDTSDTLAHFIQVMGQITNSTWMKSKCTYTEGEGINEFTFCGIEPFVYAAVYFRQMFDGDNLVQKACEIYERHAGNPIKVKWIKDEFAAFKKALNTDCTMFKNFPISALIQAFVYGALIIHGPKKSEDIHRKRFQSLMKHHPKGCTIYSLDFDMRCVCTYCAGMAILFEREMANWQHSGLIPAPDVWWHSNLFRDTPKTAGTAR